MDGRLSELTLTELVASLMQDHTPRGGGTAAAIAGAMAAAMAATAVSSSQRRAAIAELEGMESQLERLAWRLMELAEAHAGAFDALMSARHLARTDRNRDGAIGRALEATTRIPLDTAETCAEALGLLRTARRHMPKSIWAELNASEHLMQGAIASAAGIVDANLPALDGSLKAEFRERLQGASAAIAS